MQSQNLKTVTLPYNATIKQALEILGQESLRMVIVLDSSQKFIGILTDPDVRRGLLNGLGLESSIETIVNINPITASINDPKEKLFALSAKHNIYEIPIVNEKGDVVSIQSVLKYLEVEGHSNEVIIMAGGLGSRLRPLTDTTPKPMLKVGSKPILETILERFKKQGFSKITLCVNYKSEVIEEYFGDGSRLDLEIHYVKEPKRMGTAGALSLLDSKPTQDFIIINGDILTDTDFTDLLAYHSEKKSLATMGVREYTYQIPYGVVDEGGGQIKDIVEKPTQKFLVNGGIYMLNPSVLDLIPKNEFFDMPSLFKALIDRGEKNIFSYLINGYWIDIGRHDELERAKSEIGQFNV